MELSEENLDAILCNLDDINVALTGINSSLLNISNFLAVAVAQFSHLTMNDTQFIKNNEDFKFGYTDALGLHCKAYDSVDGDGKIFPLSEILEEDYGRIVALKSANNKEDKKKC